MGNVFSLFSVILLVALIAVLTIVLATKKFETSPLLVAIGVVIAITFIGLLIFSLPVSFFPHNTGKQTTSSSPTNQLTLVTGVHPDPFTSNVGASSIGTLGISSDGGAFGDENSCVVLSQNTSWSSVNGECNCEVGWFGHTCENMVYSNDYVTLTASSGSNMTIIYGTSFATDHLSLYSGLTGTGCTDQCTSMGTGCIGVTYSQGICTPITSLTFLGPPIHDTSVIENSNTLYLHSAQLSRIKMSGYYNIVYGILPPRYFVGNIISGLTGQNSYTTNTNANVILLISGTDNIFVGIPDHIIVNSIGTLYIGTTPLPITITPGNNNGLIVSFSTPANITRNVFLSNFGMSTSTTTFHIRYVQA